MDILNLNKTPYENGRLSGKYFKKNINIKKRKISNKNKIIKQFENLKKEYPKYYDEVIGKADGLGIDRLLYFSILCPEINNYNIEHCTTIMCKKDGKFIISHNEDDKYIKGNFCLSKIKIDENNWFVTNDMYNMPFGNGISWNSYGIVKTINYCHDEKININNYPRYFSQRHLSEAKSIEDLINRCKEMKVASGFHVNAIDTNNNIAVSIEVYSYGIDVEYINDYYIHTNHFIHKEYLNNPKTDEGSNSIFRLNKCKELINKKTMEEIQKILSYRSEEDKSHNSILQTKDAEEMTLFNFSYDGKITINNYINNEKLELEYRS